jgi:hypothetical protein
VTSFASDLVDALDEQLAVDENREAAEREWRAERDHEARGGGYENAPATRMLATHCAVCGRPLVDAVSVDVGIGPDCRRKYGFDQPVDEAARAEANKLVYQVALANSGLDGQVRRDAAGFAVAEAAQKIRALGFEKLAARILERACPVRVEVVGGRLVVHSPYSEVWQEAVRRVPGRHWHGKDCSCSWGGSDKKVNLFPLTSKRELFAALCRAYLGVVAYGPKGVFVIGGNT